MARQYRYDAFGGLFTGEVGPYNAVGLTGKSYDAKTGLMDYGARWYDPSVGRFTQQDPLMGHREQPASQHRYAYVGNNPLNLTDPTGLECTDPVEDPMVGEVITTWKCTSRNVSRTELRSDGWYEVGAYVTTNYTRARMKNYDGSWFDKTYPSPGGSTPFAEWVAPPSDPDPEPDPAIEQERQRQPS